MKKRFRHMRRLIARNLKVLFVFEVVYRLLGLLVMIPLSRQLMYLSIRLYGKPYIINLDLIDYAFSPTSIVIFLFLMLVFGVYLTFEIVVLSLLFYKSENDQDVSLKSLIVAGLRKTKHLVGRLHLVLILSVFIFFFTVEFFHIAGIASTFRMPPVIAVLIEHMPSMVMIVGLSIMGLLLMFGATAFFVMTGIHHVTNIRGTFKKQCLLVRHYSLRVYGEFFLMNAILNILIYGIYMAIVGLVTLVISMFYSSSAVFGIVLTIFYTLFVIVGFLFTIVLMPVNHAWINSLYFEAGTKRNHELDKFFEVSDESRRLTSKRRVKRFIAVAVVLVFSMNVLTVIETVRNPRTSIQAFQKPSIIAHRGSSASAPENTLAAIDKAIKDGADAVEIDVRFTKDDVPVLMHDETVGRTTDAADGSLSAVRGMTLQEIKGLDAGAWFDDQYVGEAVPTLKEALETARGHVDVYIELKASIRNSAVILTDIIEETGMENQVKILSFNGSLLEDIKRESPSIEIVQLIGTFFGNVNVLANNDVIDHYGFGYHILENNEDYVRAMKEQGKGVYVYTVNDDENIQYANRIGVDGIITDEPYRTRELVYSSMTNDVFDDIMSTIFQR